MDFYMRYQVLYVIAAVVLLSGCRRDISGTYLASDRSAVCWLQLVRTPDNHLTGQLVASVLGQDGKVERSSISLTGAVGGGNVTLTGSRFLGLQTTTLSGTLDGNTLTLTEMQAMPVILKRSTLRNSQTQLNELNNRSQAILTAENAANIRRHTAQVLQILISQIGQTMDAMQRFDSEADVHLSRFPGAEERYHAITGEVAGYVNHERRLEGNSNASVLRGQLDTAANQAAIATDQLHNSALSLQFSLEANAKPLIAKVDHLEQACHVTVTPGDLTAAQNNQRINACQQLSYVVTPFRQKLAVLSSGLAHLEQVYAVERKTQGEMLLSARQLQ